MKRSTIKSHVYEAAAAVLGMAMVGGLSLVALSPAQASPSDDTVVYTSDIALTASPYAGWHVGSGNGAAAFRVTSDGLEVASSSSVIKGFTTDEQQTTAYLRYSISVNEVSWRGREGGGPAYFQIPISFDGGSTVLSPVEAYDGGTDVTLEDMWTTSAAIGTGISAGSSATVRELLDAATAQGNAAVLGFGVAAKEVSTVVTAVSFRGESFRFVPGTRLTPGTVTITGYPTVGSELTAVTAGWPEGTTFSYAWATVCANMQCGSEAGTDSPTYTPTADDVGNVIRVTVTGNLAGSAPNSASSGYTAEVTTAANAPARAAGPAPAATSDDLISYLAANSIELQTQISTGLPDGPLRVDTPQTATLTWTGVDYFVDVYVYSTPTFVGTFPVSNGKVQIPLSAALLSGLPAGSHTLVVRGQSSQTVQAVSLRLAALAATGAPDGTVPLTAGALLLFIGAALRIMYRRLSV